MRSRVIKPNMRRHDVQIHGRILTPSLTRDEHVLRQAVQSHMPRARDASRVRERGAAGQVSGAEDPTCHALRAAWRRTPESACDARRGSHIAADEKSQPPCAIALPRPYMSGCKNEGDKEISVYRCSQTPLHSTRGRAQTLYVQGRGDDVFGRTSVSIIIEDG